MSVTIIEGDCRAVLATLAAKSVHCVVTSPPYFGLRAYLPDGHADKGKEIGLEPTPDAYVAEMVAVFAEVRRVLRDDGTVWCNLGDSYAANRGYQVSQTKHQSHDYGSSNAARVPAGLKPKDLIGIPWRVAFALQSAGWYLRSAIVWSKVNAMPESVTDRPTSSYEMVFLLSKSERYFYDAGAIAEPQEMKPQRRLTPRELNPNAKVHGLPLHRRPEGGTGGGLRNARNVWTIATAPFSGAHFATMPPALVERCILAGCPKDGGTVLDPFSGAGTTGLVADRLQRNAVLIELNPEYAAMARRRINGDAPLFAGAGP